MAVTRAATRAATIDMGRERIRNRSPTIHNSLYCVFIHRIFIHIEFYDNITICM
jgi:hypothetical protein